MQKAEKRIAEQFNVPVLQFFYDENSTPKDIVQSLIDIILTSKWSGDDASRVKDLKELVDLKSFESWSVSMRDLPGGRGEILSDGRSVGIPIKTVMVTSYHLNFASTSSASAKAAWDTFRLTARTTGVMEKWRKKGGRQHLVDWVPRAFIHWTLTDEEKDELAIPVKMMQGAGLH